MKLTVAASFLLLLNTTATSEAEQDSSCPDHSTCVKKCKRENKCKNLTGSPKQRKCVRNCKKSCERKINKCGRTASPSVSPGTRSPSAGGMSATVLTLGRGYHTCAINSADQLKCWGFGTSGQLGDGTFTSSLTPVSVVNLLSGDVVSIIAGQHHTCVLMSDGELQCWGRNYYGQLGNGTTGTIYNSSTPTSVINLGKVVAFDAGLHHNCAISSSGKVKCWGLGYSGQLGNGKQLHSNTPTSVVNLGGAADAVALGQYHSCALISNGDVKCWGVDSFGQLGNGGTTTPRSLTPVLVQNLGGAAVAISAGTFHSCAIINGGNVKCWGWNKYHGVLGDGTTINRNTPVLVQNLGGVAIAISTGHYHTCALISGGNLRCWGRNTHGQLGNGTTGANSLTPISVVNLGGPAVAVSVGWYHTCAMISSGDLKCWGANGYGQLGDGTKTASITPVDITI